MRILSEYAVLILNTQQMNILVFMVNAMKYGEYNSERTEFYMSTTTFKFSPKKRKIKWGHKHRPMLLFNFFVDVSAEQI